MHDEKFLEAHDGSRRLFAGGGIGRDSGGARCRQRLPYLRLDLLRELSRK